ncbi:hypothetical protein VTK26DRAFT_581 [Humicola hyalothermophila]
MGHWDLLEFTSHHGAGPSGSPLIAALSRFRLSLLDIRWIRYLQVLSRLEREVSTESNRLSPHPADRNQGLGSRHWTGVTRKSTTILGVCSNKNRHARGARRFRKDQCFQNQAHQAVDLGPSRQRFARPGTTGHTCAVTGHQGQFQSLSSRRAVVMVLYALSGLLPSLPNYMTSFQC